MRCGDSQADIGCGEGRRVVHAIADKPDRPGAPMDKIGFVLRRQSSMPSCGRDSSCIAHRVDGPPMIAACHAGAYGAPIPPGPVTVNDLWNIIPTNPDIATVELTGAELYQMIEENLERTFAADPYEQMGGYVKRMRGLTLYFKAENPSGRRVDRLFAGDAVVSPADIYKVAFVTEQGVPAKFGRNRSKTGLSAVDALKSLFASSDVFALDARKSVYEI